VNDEGVPLLEFADAGAFFMLNDSETEMITVNDKGSIKLWDLTSGQKLAEVTDTYIGKENSNKRSSIPFKIAGGRFYLIPYSNGIVSVFGSVERKVVANLFFDGSDWAVIAKDGRIDGTPSAFEKLEWREYNGNKLARTASVESSFDKYYTPRLLYTLLNGTGTESAAADSKIVGAGTLDEQIKSMPSLEFTEVNDKAVTKVPGGIDTHSSKQKNITLQVKVTANMDHIKEVRLYHNAKLVAIKPFNGTAD
jgi:hypothetical protein